MDGIIAIITMLREVNESCVRKDSTGSILGGHDLNLSDNIL